MSILKDFRDFAMRGHVLDLAVAVIISVPRSESGTEAGKEEKRGSPTTSRTLQ